MIWNGDCSVTTCSREAVDAGGLCRRHRPKAARRLRLSFAWYDLWIGAFYDQRKRVLYVCPLPCILLEWRRG